MGTERPDVTIRQSNGEVVRRGRNLRVLRDAVSQHAVESVTLSHEGANGGILHVLFSRTRVYGDRLSGAACTVSFASYAAMLGFVERWRNVQDAQLIMPNGQFASVAECKRSGGFWKSSTGPGTTLAGR